jgi:WD40 repeat protein
MRLFERCVATTLFVCSIGVTVATQDAQAQYFGRNRVQYEDFEFEVLRTEHFDIHYYPGVDVELAALMAERWYQRLSRLLDHELSDRQTLILYAAHPHFRQTNALGGTMDESTQGVTELIKRRIVLPFLGPLQETDHVIGHELVHAFQFDMTGNGGGTLISGVPGAARMPLWFVEGIAEYLSVGHIDSETAMWMRAFVERDIPIDKIGDDRALHPYQHGQALMAYIAGRWGDETIARLLKTVRSAPNVGVAFQRVLRMHPDSVMSDWYEAMRAVSEPLLDQTSAASAYGTPILGKASGSGEYNIAPALSPDGEQLVFLSEKDLFAIEMFMADATTGEVQRKMVKTSVDPYFEGVQFVQSAGSWDFSGGASSRFAFAAIRKGQPVISIMDTKTGKTVQEAAFDDLGEIFNPAWSPDGRFMVFSAIVDSKSDLFVYDLQEEERRRLTNDPFGDLQPVWSPDGSTIAFVSERFTTGLTSLMYGGYGLALLDVETGAIREVQAFDHGKHINPQWSPDGNDLYFISDQNGISNVYRLDMETSAIFQVTNLHTGVAGISPLSPAMSVAALSGEMAISVFKNGSIEIYRIDDPEVLAGGPVIEAYAGVNPAILPPADRMSNEVLALIDNPFFGLPADSQNTNEEYHGSLGLDYVGQPSLVVGADRFGTFIGGGTSLFWSDILGGRNLATMFQINGGVKDISAAVAYTNMSNRLNWGVTLQQMSNSYRFYEGSGQRIDDNTGQLVWVDQFLRVRQISRDLGGIVSYPFSRVHRAEFSAGLRNLSYDYERQSSLIAWTGELVDQIKESLDSPPPLYMAVSSAALVYDNSFYGIASPILGQRYRIEVSPMYGSLNMVTGLVDFRKYIMPVRPFTFAGRLMHYGRYGSGAGDQRIRPMFIGYSSMVRGYDYSSFTSSECVPGDNSGSCPVFDQLWGSSIIVGNAELRFPPLGVLGIGNGYFGYLPLEMAVFADGGLAWSTDNPETVENDKAFFMGGDRRPVYSAGVSFRFNLFGYFMLGMDVVKPFQRPGKGWHMQFNMSPGF